MFGGEFCTVSTLSTRPFLDEAKVVLRDVRSTLAALVDAVGADPSQPQEMSRRFALDKTLTWKIARIVCEDDAWAAAAHIPGRAGLRIFVDALERAGAPADRSRNVMDALERFERLIEVHSGDRETFEIMVGSVSEPLARKRAESFRKMSFQGNSAVWGVQARAQVAMQTIAPNRERPGRLDLAVLCGLVDFRRLRQDACWAVASQVSFSDDGSDALPATRPMDSTLSPRDVPIMREFCSSPTPEIRAVHGANSRTRYEFTEGPIGNTAAATCVLGWVLRGDVSMYRTPADWLGEHLVYLNTPVEMLYHDIYIHRSLAFAIPPTVHLYSQMPGGPSYPRDGRDKGMLSVPEEMIDLGAGPPDCTTPGMPGFRRMMERSFEAVGWPASDFHGFRFRLRYPPVPTVSVFRHPLAEPQ
jgi:hypothetical protein